MKSKLSLLFVAVLLSTSCVVRVRAKGGPGPRSGDQKKDAYVDARSGWDKLGERWVDGAVDYDVIAVGAKEGEYRKVMLVVEKSSVELYDLRFTFGDGSVFSPSTRYAFGPNENTRVIDLPGGDRVIRKVEFKYSNLPGGGRAQVELWAK
jgi:hypothetical protein